MKKWRYKALAVTYIDSSRLAENPEHSESLGKLSVQTKTELHANLNSDPHN